MSFRAYKSTSHYPSFNHTSFNLEWIAWPRDRQHKIELSFHVRYGIGGNGFWFGLRPEIEIHRSSDRGVETLRFARKLRAISTCSFCGAKEAGSEGLGLPENWERVNAYQQFCVDCSSSIALKELLAHG